MNKIKKALISVLVIIMLICPSFVFAQDGSDIVIIYTNDMHSAIDKDLGFADVAALKAIETAKGNQVILVDAGDAIQGDLAGTISKGEYIIELMNNAGYDLAIPGNHEFDYGADRFFELTEKANFPYLSANITDVATGKTILDPYKIFVYEGIEIAFVAATTPTTKVTTTPKNLQDKDGNYIYDFGGVNDFYAIIQKNIDAAKAEGADVVIALTHVGDDIDNETYTSVEMIQKTTGLSAVIDAHQHSVIDGVTYKDKAGNGVLLTSTGTKFQNIGLMRVSTDGKVSVELVQADYKAEGLSDAAKTTYDTVQATVDEIKARYEKEFEKVVATTEYDLTINDPAKYTEEKGAVRRVRNGSTNLAEFCADAYRTAGRSDIALANGGGVRADIPKGNVTYGQLLNVNPYGNNICVIEVTGSQIVDALEHGVKSFPGESGGFLHGSGLTYQINGDIPTPVVTDDAGAFLKIDGERRVKNVLVNGAPISLTAKYTLCGNDFMLLQGGDGFTMFAGATVINPSVCNDVDALISYAQDTLGGKIGEAYKDPYGEGRVSLYTAEEVTTTGFTDTVNHWAKEEIAKATELGIVTGATATTFNPNGDTSRAMFITMLYRLDGAKAVETKATYTDVKEDAYYAAAVNWATETEITLGTGNGKFSPNANITREQMISMLYRYAQLKGFDVSVGEDTNILSYDDAFSIHEYAIPAMQWGCGAGIINGMTDTTLAPEKNATRAQSVAMMMRLLNTVTEVVNS